MKKVIIAIILYVAGLSMGYLYCYDRLKRHPSKVMQMYRNTEYQLLDRIGPDKCKEYFMLTDSVESACDTIYNQ